MCNGNDCALTKPLPDDLLDMLIGPIVYLGGGFVQTYNFAVLQDCPSQTDQLFLSNAEYLRSNRHIGVQSL